jgi:hypothetical protein
MSDFVAIPKKSGLDTESRGGDEVVWILAFARITFSDSL